MGDYAFGRASKEALEAARESALGWRGGFDDPAGRAAQAVGQVAFGWIGIGEAISNAASSAAFAALEDVQKTVGDRANLYK